MRRKIAALALSGAVCLALAIPASGAQASPAKPAGQSASPASTRISAASASDRCLLWKKETEGPKGIYEGATAGYSWAWNVTVGPGATGNRVKEIQCLTDHWVGKPAALDGVYGPDTTAAVKATQKELGIDWCGSADGIVGPKTWRCMREAVAF
jgi:peptidoglycan hydrolase-like protein with peptidoglycan-binding domain